MHITGSKLRAILCLFQLVRFVVVYAGFAFATALITGCDISTPRSLTVTPGLPIPDTAAKLLDSLPEATFEIEIWLDEETAPTHVTTATINEQTDTINTFRVTLPTGRHTLRLEEFINDPRFGRVRIATTEPSFFQIEVDVPLNFNAINLAQPLPDDDRDGVPNVHELWARTRPDLAEDVPGLPAAAQLISFSVEGITLSPRFDPSRSYYTGNVVPESDHVIVTAQPQSTGASILINDQIVEAGANHTVALQSLGNTTLRLVVTVNSVSATYYVVLVRDKMNVTVDPWNGSAQLNWRSNASSYNIYRYATPECDIRYYTTCDEGSLTVNATSPFDATGLTNGKRYYFQIEAVYSDGVRILSNPLQARPNPVVLNCCVKAITVSDEGIAYVGGSFTRAGITTGYGLPLNAKSMDVIPDFDAVNGEVHAVVADGQGGWYIGGKFTRVGNLTRNYLAHVLSSGTVNPNWDAKIERTAGTLPYANTPIESVTALAITHTTLYFSGSFAKVNGETRQGLAAVDHTSRLLPWAPERISNFVYAMAADSHAVYVGGSFTQVGTTPRKNFASLDVISGALLQWTLDVSGTVNALTLTPDRLFIGGSFNTINEQTRTSIAAIDLDNMTLSEWNPQMSVDPMVPLSINTLALGPEELYVGGSFNRVDGQARNNAAAFTLTGSATLTVWNPQVSGIIHTLAVTDSYLFLGGKFNRIGALPCNHFAAVDTITASSVKGCSLNPESPVYAVSSSGNHVYAGGAFLFLGGRTRARLAAMDNHGVITDWAPSVNREVTETGPSVEAMTMAQGNIIVGGQFSEINESSHQNFAAIRPDGSVSAWNPSGINGVQTLAAIDNSILIGNGGNLTALTLEGGVDTRWNHQFTPDQTAAGGNRYVDILAIAPSVDLQQLYIAGRFTGVDNVSAHRHIALFDRAGTLLPWSTSIEGLGGYTNVNALGVVPGGVFIGGRFYAINSTPRHLFGGVDGTSGEVLPLNTYVDSTVNAIDALGSHIYIGGLFTQIAGEPRRGLAVLGMQSTDGKPLNWRYDTNGNVLALNVWGNTVFTGGEFSTINDQLTGSFALLPRLLPQ